MALVDLLWLMHSQMTNSGVVVYCVLSFHCSQVTVGRISRQDWHGHKVQQIAFIQLEHHAKVVFKQKRIKTLGICKDIQRVLDNRTSEKYQVRRKLEVKSGLT